MGSWRPEAGSLGGRRRSNWSMSSGLGVAVWAGGEGWGNGLLRFLDQKRD
jgi:hypothetical protein